MLLSVSLEVMFIWRLFRRWKIYSCLCSFVQQQSCTDRVACFLADLTSGCAIATVLRLSSSVCLWRYVLWLNGAS